MERDKVAALRRVAIVLSSLPDSTARRLLANLELDHQRAVRAAIGHLDDVDPLERRRALDGFTTSIRQGRSSVAGENDAAEIVLSRVAMHRDDGRVPNPTQDNRGVVLDGPKTGGSAAFAFLSAVDDDAIAHRIKDEHPQTIATVLASIAPRQAARLLAKLGVALRAETMRRLAKMDVPTPEVVEEIAAQLKQKLVHANGGMATTATSATFVDSSTQTGSSTGQSRSPGQAALQAILAEMNPNNGQPASGIPGLQSGYTGGYTGDYTSGYTSGYTGSYTGGSATYGGEEYTANDRRSGQSSDPTPRGRAASQDERHESVPLRRPGIAIDSTSASNHHPESAKEANAKVDRPTKSIAEVHSQLISTPPAKLREALASVDGRQAILALCGLPKATAEAVLSDLPRRQAKQIRQQIASLGMLELREIDAAKEAVANAIRPAENRSLRRVAPGPMATSSATLAAA